MDDRYLTTAIALGKIFAGEPLDKAIDDTPSRLGQKREDNDIHLRTLTRITVKTKEYSLLCRRNEFFCYPAVVEAHCIQEILKVLDLDIQKYRCADAIVKSSILKFKNVESGFWTKWEIMLGPICIGEIKETGPFYDRDSEIKLDFRFMK